MDAGIANAQLRVEDLPNDPVLLRGIIAQLLKTNASLNTKLTTLQQQLEQLTHRLYGRSSERWDPNQTLLDELLISALEQRKPAEAVPAATATVPAHQRKITPHGRTIFPETLRHEVVVIPVPEAERKCPITGKERPIIGYEEAKKLDYRQPELVVKVYRREKRGSVAGAEEVGVVTAPPPVGPVPKGLLDNGLIAHLAVGKFVDHLPLYRMEKIFERQRVSLTRQTICDTLLMASEPLERLTALVRQRIVGNSVVLHDDTPVDVAGEPGHNGQQIKEGRLWVATVPVRDGPWVHFTFTLSREGKHVEDFFRDYTGKVMSDDFAGYDRLDPGQRLACWAHVRRKFFEARDDRRLEAAEILERIKSLYALEAEIGPAPELDAQRLVMRQAQALPRLLELRTRLDAWAPNTLPKSPLGKAIGYATNNWDRLLRYTQDPRLPIDNNAAEQAIRPVAIGRKNWLFMGSERGGRAAAIYMTLAATCKRAGINPYDYFRDVFARILDHSAHKLGELLPDRWSPLLIR